ncbi:hypothetical protein J7E91_20390 [Streptomyces sp. ISL-99]|uniref:hypothetical protein n=1 Tax=Streptomyces sp. ISL-99 TaxID=2819193 RepID=UPI001BEB77E3|nr:hypothetical protein [Streptomyces sp. ISL-99]MBT2527718.1 hypothetical protein [Streptomyces sp. ISL-99]
MVVVDRDDDMVGRVRAVHGKYVEIERPAGLRWTTNYTRLRRATEYEARQLRALAKLLRDQRRGRHPLP